MPSVSTKHRLFTLARPKEPPFRDHLLASALATALFLVLFSRALFAGYNYGSLPKMQFMGVMWQNPWIGNRDEPVTERQPSVVDPDHHFLYGLDNLAAARDLKAGHLPFFDFSRMLGVPLWGSVIYDFANPLNLLLRYLSVPQVHLVKILFCMLLAANGFVVLMRGLGAATSVAWIVATMLYLETNYAIYYVHWDGAYGLTCVAPMLLGTVLRFLRTGGAGWFVGVVACGCFLFIAQCVHIAINLIILCGVSCLVTLLLGRRDWKTLLPRVALLGFAGVCAVTACFEVLRQIQLTAADSSRLPAVLEMFPYPHRPIPQVSQLYSYLFFGNIETSGAFWEAPFLPCAALLSICGLFALRQERSRELRVLGWVTVFYLFYFYVGWLDAPFIMFLGKIYAPNPLAWRGLVDLWLPVAALAGLGAERLLPEPIQKWIRLFAWIGLGMVTAFAVAAVSSNEHARGMVFGPSGWLYDSYVRSSAFWLLLAGNAVWLGAMLLRKADKLKTPLIIASVVATFVGMESGRLPFYRPEDVAQINRGEPADINTPRVTRLLPGTEYLLGAAKIDQLFAIEAPLSSLGLKMLNGYHTSMSKQELKVYDALVSDYHLKARQSGQLRTFSFGFYRPILDGRAVVEGNTVRPEKLLVLKLLGVEYVIDGVGLSRINRESAFKFSEWPGVSLQVSNACHLAEGTEQKDIVALFSGKLPAQKVNEMLIRMKEVRLEPIGQGEGYKLNLAGSSGTVVVPYHLGRWFKVTLDGRVISEPEGLGLCLVEVTPQSQILEIRPRREGMVARLVASALAGLVLTTLGCFLCRTARSRQNVKPLAVAGPLPSVAGS
jgi:hypothetical protein